MRTLTLLIALLLTTPALAQSKQLRWRWTEGARYTITYTSIQDQVMDNTASGGSKVPMKITYRGTTLREVVSVSPDGVAQVIDRPQRIVLTMESPTQGKSSFDTSKPKMPMGNPMLMVLGPKIRRAIGKPIQMTIDSRGKISKLAMPGFRGTAAVMKQLTRHTTVPLPKDGVESGKRWAEQHEVELMAMAKLVKANFINRYTYSGPTQVEGKSLESIAVAQEVEGKADPDNPLATEVKVKSSSGRLLFDPARGQVTQATVKTAFDLKQGGIDIAQTMTTTVKIVEAPSKKKPKK